MSEGTDDDSAESGTALPTTASGGGGRPNLEMSVIGWLVFLGLLVLFLPILPMLALVYVIARFLDSVMQPSASPE